MGFEKDQHVGNCQRKRNSQRVLGRGGGQETRLLVLGTAFLRSDRGTQPPIAGKAVEGQDQGEATERGSREALVTSRQTCLQLSGVQCKLSTQTQPGHAVP